MTVFKPQPSILWKEVEQSLIDWAQDMTGLVAVFGRDEGAQPDRPYVELEWLKYPTALGDDYFSETYNPDTTMIERTLEGVRDSMVTVTVHASSKLPGENAAYFMDLLSNSLNSETVVSKYFQSVRMAPWNWEDIDPGNFIEDEHTKDMAAMDVQLGFAAGTGEASEDVFPIESVSIEGTITTPATTYTQTLDIESPTS